MRDYRFVGPVNPPGSKRQVRNDVPPPKGGNVPRGRVIDPVVQRQAGSTQPGELAQFDGLSDQDNENVIGFRYVPPDTNGDVGPNHYVEYINAIWSIYDKSGTLLLGPLPGNSFWQGLGGVCETTNDGDPIVKYDRQADRWLVSQFSVEGPFDQCIAISQTGDPTGAWFQYDFPISATDFPDYPKFGIWPDAYYMTSNVFGSSFYGGAFAFDRTKMLAGDPSAAMIFFTIEDNGVAEGGVLPSDMNGLAPPPAGAPNYFMTFDVSPSRLLIWQFHADFAVPANSTFTGPVELSVPDFVTPVCGADRDQCVPQLGSSELLETLSQDLMYPLPYRNLGDHEAILASHTVGDGTGVAQVRWYEIRDPGGTPTVHQASTYAPDGTHRWMPSIAMDRQGNIALNYSRSDATLHPQAAITGRLVGDPLNAMGAEDIWFAGTGSQQDSFSRWGDYTSIFLDPVDDCTFWAINEYYETTTDFQFKTRIGSFKFPSCTAGPTGTLEGTVTDASNGNPIAGAKVTANSSQTTTDATGHFQLKLPVGTYDLTASKFGYLPESVNGVLVTDAGDTVQNFVLEPAPSFVVNGVVKDGSGGDWPLYASIRITAPGFSGTTVYTDPVTGYYNVTLLTGTSYVFAVNVVSPGYAPVVRTVAPSPATAPGGQIENFTPIVDPTTCIAPGYSLQGPDCVAGAGGLVVGNVRDANTGLGLNGATVVNLPSDGSTTTFDTPNDPNQDDGFYILFARSGPQPFEASLSLYGDDFENATVIPNSTVRRDFSLAAGRLTATPTPLVEYLDPGPNTGNLTLTLTNSGGRVANFELTEINARPTSGPTRRGPFANPEEAQRALARIPTGRLNARDTSGIPPLSSPPANAAPSAVGNVINAYPSGLALPWGVLFNTDVTDFWLSNLALGGGDNLDYRFLTDGTSTGDTIDTSPWVADFAGDGTYNQRTGMLWEVNVGGDNCVHEMNPASRLSTGNKICPPFGVSQRGLAYDPKTDTYYSGSWEDAVLNHFDSSGTILDSVYLSISISGLAYNSATGHLFAMTNHPPFAGFDVFVYDAKNNYSLLSAFFIKSNGVPVLSQFGGAGLEIDCNGHLWLVDQNTQTIYEAESGEDGVCDFQDISWLSETPASGTVAASSSLDSTVTFDATGLTPGLRQAQIIVRTDTPYGVLDVPVDLIVRFLDVADGDPFAPFIYGLAGAGVTAGCGGNDYCPSVSVSRAQMAVFIEKALHGPAFIPPPATGIFGDVPPGSFGADFIEQLFGDGITGGCGGGNYCPDDAVSRAQMAVLIVKAVHGSAFVPPPAVGVFGDVSPGSFAADYIEQLFNDGVTGGCGGGDYCPDDPVTRGQMAVFIVKAFALPHYP